MATTLRVKPSRAMGTQKQHCPTVYIPSPCEQRGSEHLPNQVTPPPLPLVPPATWQGSHATG